MDNRPKVGVGVLIFRNSKILLGKRKGSHGEGEYNAVGGHVEYMESLEQALKREIKEECGLDVQNIQFLCVLNVTQYKPKHYIDIGFTADWKGGEPKVLEPDRIDGWDWYDIEALPSPLFKIDDYYVEAYKTGRKFFDSE